MQKKIILTILGATLIVGGGAYALASINPTQKTAPLVTTKAPVVTTAGNLSLSYGEYEGEIKDGLASGQGTVTYANGDKYIGAFLFGQESGKGITTHTEDQKTSVGEVTFPILTEVPKVPHDVGHRVPEPDDGYYHVRTDRPAGIIIYSVTFHQGFRAEGLQSVDVHIMARSQVNGENRLVQGRDEIVSITGSTGKVYDMTGTKRTGVNTGAIPTATSSFEEQELTEYQDVSVNEKSITSIVVRRDGKNITITPDKDTKVETTHA